MRSSLFLILFVFFGFYSCIPQQRLPNQERPSDNINDRKQPALTQASLCTGQTSSSNRDVIVHMFNVPFAQIQKELPFLAQAGYGQIQISPPQLSNGGPWWGRYQPLDYRVIDGPLGDEQALRSLIQEAQKCGIRIIADVVLNHMANLGPDFDLNYPPQWVRQKYQVTGLFGPQDFKPAFCIRNWDNPTEVVNGRLCGGDGDSGLPDLDLSRSWVIETHRAYLKKLIDLGIKGFRVDAVKHMEVSYFAKVFTPDLLQGTFVFGEVIANQWTFDRDLKPYLEGTSMGLMDFPLQQTLKDAFGLGGSLRALVDPVRFKGALSWDRAITFIVNHDIPNNDGFRYLILDPKDEQMAYTYILGRDAGVPHIYSDLGIADGRQEDRWKQAHRAPTLVKKIGFHNAMHGTSQKVVYVNDCVLVFQRGEKGLVSINKCENTFAQDVQTTLTQGAYHDVLSSQTIDVQAPTVRIQIPGRSSVMYLHDTKRQIQSSVHQRLEQAKKQLQSAPPNQRRSLREH
ncbi:MAG: alpha-amylase family glycosyl hydrolase, partial [Myxococcota bacterium]